MGNEIHKYISYVLRILQYVYTYLYVGTYWICTIAIITRCEKFWGWKKSSCCPQFSKFGRLPYCSNMQTQYKNSSTGFLAAAALPYDWKFLVRKIATIGRREIPKSLPRGRFSGSCSNKLCRYLVPFGRKLQAASRTKKSKFHSWGASRRKASELWFLCRSTEIGRTSMQTILRTIFHPQHFSHSLMIATIHSSSIQWV